MSEINSVELTKAQEDELAMELARADFIKRVGKAAGGIIPPGLIESIGVAFTTGFKMGVAWRDEP